MLIGLVISIVVAAAAVVACVYFSLTLKTARAESTRLSATLAQREQAIEGYIDEIEQGRAARAELAQQLAVTHEKERGLREQFEEAQKRARETFQSLAGEALQQSTRQFLELAKKTFENEQKEATAQLEQRKQAIEQLIKPVRETLDKHAKAVTDIEKEREGAYRGLKQQLASMIEDQQLLRLQTQNLNTALRRSDVRGKWGELSLRRIAEMAGMVAHCDFTEQTTVHSEDGRLRPDMVVKLPSDRTIVIDAKAPMSSYLDALEADNPDDRKRMMQQHLAHLESHVRDLSNKNYTDQFERSPDFVILFIPGDSFLHPAVELKPDLLESAIARRVIIATPTTLISLLRVIAMGWREEKIADNARRVCDLGKELHERIAKATGDISSVGTHLKKAVECYNSFVGSYESRVLTGARKFENLHVDSGKKLPEEMKEVEVLPRELRQIEN